MRRSAWSAALVAVLALFLPVTCLGCGSPDRAVCPDCRAALAASPRRVRLVAGVRLDAAFEYEGLVRTLLLELKLRGRTDVAALLGRRTAALVRQALAASPPGTVVARIPPSPRGRRRRGFDTVVLLLATGGVRGTRPLRRRRGATAGQKERSALERVDATVESLRAERFRGRDVVVVDDVVTTGVTMAEAVRAVRAAGGRVTRCVATASVES
ncbi:phosphoribosyltransferase family protein [Curtobacterium sp. 9128]|uniref:phosphoribosyltransferase family protein n=1 Tax=Curtobacterium sp. 9128 TaxID=1793722 RepID=UPI001642E5E9|nr:phosphoribosyltransferase family protein [Curtobacterium sp. 9128]